MAGPQLTSCAQNIRNNFLGTGRVKVRVLPVRPARPQSGLRDRLRVAREVHREAEGRPWSVHPLRHRAQPHGLQLRVDQGAARRNLQLRKQPSPQARLHAGQG